MSVRASHWVLVGANIGVEHYHDEYWEDDKYAEEYEEFFDRTTIGEITYLLDSLGNRYFMVGIVLVHSEKEMKNPFLVNKDYSEEKERIKSYIRKRFHVEIEPSITVLTHKE